MITLALVLFSSALEPARFRLDLAGSVNVAPVVHGYGAFVAAAAHIPIWGTKKVGGAIHAGGRLGYHNAPYSQLDPTLRGAEHRAHGWASLGHDVCIFPDRRLQAGVHVLLGYSERIMDGWLQGVAADFSTRAGTFVFGLELSVSYFFIPRVGIATRIALHPVPDQQRIVGIASFSLGIVFSFGP